MVSSKFENLPNLNVKRRASWSSFSGKSFNSTTPLDLRTTAQLIGGFFTMLLLGPPRKAVASPPPTHTPPPPQQGSHWACAACEIWLNGCWHPWDITQGDKGHPVEGLIEVRTSLELAAKRLRSPFVFFVSFCVCVAVGSDVGMGKKTDRRVRSSET